MPSSACDWSSDVCSSDRSEEHTSELQSRSDLVCRLLLEKKKKRVDYRNAPDDNGVVTASLSVQRCATQPTSDEGRLSHRANLITTMLEFIAETQGHDVER